jgi:RNA methyltransferase, TrmH family
MLSKNEIKDIQSLSHKKFRKALKLFVAEGPKIVRELLDRMPQQFEKIYALKEWLAQNSDADLSKAIEINEAELEKISGLQTPNQVVAIIRQPDAAAPAGDSLVLYLDTIQDPGNLGTIIRTADWFGIRHIVCSEGCAELYNPKVIQSTMASIARVNVFYDEDGGWLQNQQLPVYAATLHGRPLETFTPLQTGVLVIGNESKGISDEVLQFATEQITISKKGHAESLNAAVATGILLSHLVK